jgi:RNA polymerase sigma-70 factor (ECF subfamily)
MDLTNRLAADLDTAFPDLVRQLQDRVFSTALRLCRHRQDAEDIAQETFVRVYRALSGFPASRIQALELAPYVWRTTVNLCRNRARTARRHPQSELIELPESTEVSFAETVDAAHDWSERLALLSERQRTAVVLRHVAGLSYAEVADVMAVPVGTAKADVHRGIRRLRDLLRVEAGEMAI